MKAVGADIAEIDDDRYLKCDTAVAEEGADPLTAAANTANT